MHTVNNPASRLLIPVMHVMEKMIAMVRLMDGVGSEDSATVVDGTHKAWSCTLGSKLGGEREGVFEPTLGNLGMTGAISIMRSWTSVPSIQFDKNNKKEDCAAGAILSGDTQYYMIRRGHSVCGPSCRLIFGNCMSRIGWSIALRGSGSLSVTYTIRTTPPHSQNLQHVIAELRVAH